MRLLLSFLLLFVAAPTRASTSSSIEGEMTIPYSCAITVPSSQELVVNGAQAQATDTWTFIQNDRTIYSMTPVTISNKPDNAKVIGSITLEYDGGSGGGAASAFDFRASETKGAFADVPGNLGSAVPGTVKYKIIETGNPRFYAGDYRLSTVLSCAQATSSEGIAYAFDNQEQQYYNYISSTGITNYGSGQYMVTDGMASANPIVINYGVSGTTLATSGAPDPGYTITFGSEAQRQQFQSDMTGMQIADNGMGTAVAGTYSRNEMTLTGNGNQLNIQVDGGVLDTLTNEYVSNPGGSVVTNFTGLTQ